MSIRLGAEGTSELQQRFLGEARGAPDEHKARLLAIVLGDSDVSSGHEPLHPEWLEIFESVRDRLSDFVPRRDLRRITDALGEFGQDEQISTVDPSSAQLAFLLGAGASKPKPSDIPTVKELLPDLLTRARRLDRPDLRKLADFCDEASIDNIEDLLTAAQLSEFCSRNPSVLRLVDFLIYRRMRDSEERYSRRPRGPSADLSAVAFLQDTLQMLFGLLSSRMLPAQPNAGHSAIAEYVKANPTSAIVTTNYDCCMDLALEKADATFSYVVDFANAGHSGESGGDMASLIKLHGSLNWFYCETCQQVHLIDIERTVKEYLADESCYAVIAICKDCGGQRRGLILPPLAMKFDVAPPLTPLIGSAQGAFNKADVVVVVGFSFAEADMYISRMLTKSMQLNPKVRAVVFDPDYDVAQKLRRQLSLRVPDFDEKRVIHVHGDCASTLPQFLEGKLSDSSTKPLEPSGRTRKSKRAKTAHN